MCQRRALAAFHTASFLAAAAQRYEANQIYTSINAMMLAINPYADLGLYAPSVVALYGQFGDTGPPPPPHIFGVAAVGTLPSYHPLAARLRRGGGGPPHLRPARRPLTLALALALALTLARRPSRACWRVARRASSSLARAAQAHVT